MARPLRIEYIGAWYHVMNRGTGRRRTFPDDVLRREFLRLVGDLHDVLSAPVGGDRTAIQTTRYRRRKRYPYL